MSRIKNLLTVLFSLTMLALAVAAPVFSFNQGVERPCQLVTLFPPGGGVDFDCVGDQGDCTCVTFYIEYE